MFPAYIEQVLVPALLRNCIAVMENFRAHEFAGVQEAIEKARAAVRCLPKYLFDFGAIKMCYGSFTVCCAKW
jgi:hypothetical protein